MSSAAVVIDTLRVNLAFASFIKFTPINFIWVITSSNVDLIRDIFPHISDTEVYFQERYRFLMSHYNSEMREKKGICSRLRRGRNAPKEIISQID